MYSRIINKIMDADDREVNRIMNLNDNEKIRYVQKKWGKGNCVSAVTAEIYVYLKLKGYSNKEMRLL